MLKSVVHYLVTVHIYEALKKRNFFSFNVLWDEGGGSAGCREQALNGENQKY